jgi:hypothetical protein
MVCHGEVTVVVRQSSCFELVATRYCRIADWIGMRKGQDCHTWTAASDRNSRLPRSTGRPDTYIDINKLRLIWQSWKEKGIGNV